MPQHKKGYGALALIAVGVISIVGWSIYQTGKAPSLSSVSTSNVQADPVVQVQQASGGCPDTLLTSVGVQTINPLNTSGTVFYPSSTVYVIDDAGIVKGTITVDSDSAFETTNVNCGRNYKGVAVYSQNNLASSGKFDIEATGGSVEFYVKTPVLSQLQGYVYDEIDKEYMRQNGFGNTTNTAVVLNGTANFRDTTTNIAEPLGNSEAFEFTATISAQTIYSGFSGVKKYVLVDADKTDYETVVVYQNGVQLQDRKNLPSLDDASYTSAYEYAFEMRPEDLTTLQQPIKIAGQTKASGTVDADIVVWFVAEQYALDSGGSTIVSSVFDTSGNERAYSLPNRFTIDIS